MGGSETDGRSTAVDVAPVVVVVGNVELALILRTVVVAVADQRGLPVVGELVPGEGEEVRGTLGVEETVEVVLVGTVDAFGGEVVVIDPDVGRSLDVDAVHLLRGVAQDEVTDDDVVGLDNTETTVGET